MKHLSSFNLHLSTVVLAVTAFVLSSCGGADRAHQLKVLNWADYINEEVKENFEQWYFDQTGEKVELVYETFDINETALTKIEVGHEDYDVFCPRSISSSACSRKTC